MQRTWMGFFCACMLLCSAFSAEAAPDVSEQAQKRMSIVLSELSRNRLFSVDSQQFFNPKQPEMLLTFAARYVEDMFPLSKGRLAPALMKSGGSAPLGERLVSMEDVKSVIKRLFDYDLPAVASGQYGSVHFDGKDVHMRMSDGGLTYWLQVQQATVQDDGNIAVKGVMREPERHVMGTFTAQLKPILWKSLQTYAVLSLTTTMKEE